MNNGELSRRAFIRNTSLTAAGAIAGALAGNGCTLSKNTKLGDISNVDTSKILNYNPKMGYRRLGKTDLIVSEIVLGGHFNNPSGQHFWAKFVNDKLPTDVAKNRTEIVSRCIDYGINAGLIFRTSRQNIGQPCKSTPEDYELARHHN